MSEPLTGPGGLTAAELADLEAIFAEAADADSDARQTLLASRCDGRPRLKAEVEALLASHDGLGDFLAAPEEEVGPEGSEADGEDSDRLRIGSLVGPYRLIEQIGEGGMGNVYLAERADGLFSHRVAIKVTRTSVRDGDTARRFRAERQILASLQHANIVTLLDGGVTAVGEAYLVMEYVAGVPITRHCRTLALPLEERVQLIRQVSRAVQFAHQRGIVHRDLKPGNILVSADGVAKVLDFGVAKLLESSAGGDSTLTRAFPGPLTPNYASPEQLRGLPVTTASDVYALGVLTYEVVTGVRPYDTSGKTLDQVLEMVLETEPSRPSAASAGLTGDAPAYSRTRLKGDLDAVVLKAMSKEADRRYGSAGELADDLERFLTGKPVVAREPSMGYMLRRMAGRHKAVVTFAAAAILAIIAALGVAVWQRQLAVSAQARAEQRFKDVRQLSNALIFKIHDAVTPLAGSTPVRQTIVNEALAYLERLEAESAGDESLQLELSGAYRQVGGILGDRNRPNLGDREGAVRQFEKARSLVLPLATRAEPSLTAMAALVNTDVLLSAAIWGRDQRNQRAADLGREAVEYAERLTRIPKPHAEARALLARAMFNLALLMHPAEAAVPVWKKTIELYEAELRDKPDDPNRQRNVALGEKYLGGIFDGLNRDAEAESHYRRAMELDEQRLTRAPDNRTAQFDMAIDLANLASILEGQQRLDEAHPLLTRSLAMRRQLSDSDPKDQLAKSRLGYVAFRVARLELKLGRKARSLELAKEAVEVTESVTNVIKDPGSQRDLAMALATRGSVEASMGARTAACASFRRSHRILQTVGVPSADEYYVSLAVAETVKCDKER